MPACCRILLRQDYSFLGCVQQKPIPVSLTSTSGHTLGYKSIQVINLSGDLGLVSYFLLTSCRQFSGWQAGALKCPLEAVIFPQMPKKLRRLA